MMSRGNDSTQHEQVHHRQAIQCLADLKKHEPLFQDHMDIVLQDIDKSLTVKAVRERQQICSILEMMEIKTSDNIPSLIAWAKHIEQYSTPTPSNIANHLASLLMKPEILLGLHFESELGEYFEITTSWHSQPGETNTRNNFRMLELHTFWFEFIIPWWKRALTKPKEALKKRLNIGELTLKKKTYLQQN